VWRCCCRAWVWAGGCSVAPSGGVEQTPSGLPGVIVSCDGETCSDPQAGRHVPTGGPSRQVSDGPVNVLQAAIANSHVRKAAAASIPWHAHALPADARRLAAEVGARRAETQRGLAADGPRLAALVAATAAAKARAEAGVAALFPGRTVNVMGEINNVLSAA